MPNPVYKIGISVYLIFICHGILADNYPKNPAIDILHYSFSIKLSDDKDEIQGSAVIEVQFNKDGIDRVRLDLINQSEELEGMGMVIDSLCVEQVETPYSHDNDVILIQLLNESKENDRIKITIKYHGIPA